MTVEHVRLEEERTRRVAWSRWGPYVSERAWGTVREDYSADGSAWTYFPHDHARSRAYRWNEDGIAGFSDVRQRICLALSLWNGRDAILKERLFGLSGPEGNHGEDVKEYYFHLDGTPTHSWMRFLYKYPQGAFPYDDLVAENGRRTRQDPEYELLDTGIFDGDRYFDVEVSYAKADAEDLLVRIQATNRGPEPAPLHLLPTIWFRNRWSWDDREPRPMARLEAREAGRVALRLDEPYWGTRWLYAAGDPAVLFTENETNFERLFGTANRAPYVKDGIDAAVVHGRADAVNPANTGTKAALHYTFEVPAGGTVEVRLRLSAEPVRAAAGAPLGEDYESVLSARAAEADEFYGAVIPEALDAERARVMRQALSGLLWSKQYYHYVVAEWLDGDPAQPPPPPERLHGRNHDWRHLFNADVLSMPDTWEYPWYASWDLAFHTVPLALVDPEYAKYQLVLLLREWYMHPNGQIPAYEWAFGDVNPPVHAWAALRVFHIERDRWGRTDYAFLERVFHKLLLNFTWWVNRKDAQGNNIFEGGFLGLDNIGVFDRDTPLGRGMLLEQADGTAWMAMYALNMLAIALELTAHDPAYEDMASKFWEHFLTIGHAMNSMGADGGDMWDAEDGFYYDVLRADGASRPMRVRSVVGLIPLFAVQTLEPDALERMPEFRRRLEWFIANRSDLTDCVASMALEGERARRLLSLLDPTRLRRVLDRVLDPAEFLSRGGVRALSRTYLDHPYSIRLDGQTHTVAYEPGESVSGLFGGNSNWRGPVWFPVNFLLIESLLRFHGYLGDGFRVHCPTESGHLATLREVSRELAGRLVSLFLRGPDGRRPAAGDSRVLQQDPHWRDLPLFHEYFHGDTGKGLGASHQTGWTALVATLLARSAPDGGAADDAAHLRVARAAAQAVGAPEAAAMMRLDEPLAPARP